MSETMYVTPAQVLAAQLEVELSVEAGEEPDPALEAIANAHVIKTGELSPPERARLISARKALMSFMVADVTDGIAGMDPEWEHIGVDLEEAGLEDAGIENEIRLIRNLLEKGRVHDAQNLLIETMRRADAVLGADETWRNSQPSLYDDYYDPAFRVFRRHLKAEEDSELREKRY